MPHYYNVLAWYHVTDVWCEKGWCKKNPEGVKYGMVRLEKIDLGTKSWWAPAGSPLPDPQRNINAITTTSQVCPKCQQQCAAIFEQGWCCLNTLCRGFFEFDLLDTVSQEAFYKALVYNPSFLEKRTLFQGQITQPLVPQLPAIDQIGTSLLGYESQFKEGVVCPDCGACSRRIQWEKWSCENPDCSWTLRAPPSVVSIAQATSNLDPEDKPVDGKMIPSTPGMPLGNNYSVVEYAIPGERDASGNHSTNAGIIRHFIANDVINSQPNGPNDLYHQMQKGEFGLQRKPVRQPGCESEGSICFMFF